jgi:hypothetical protein
MTPLGQRKNEQRTIVIYLFDQTNLSYETKGHAPLCSGCIHLKENALAYVSSTLNAKLVMTGV